MSIFRDKYRNLDAYIMENDSLRLAVLPQLGGKLASICYKPQGFEVLFQPTEGIYSLPAYGDDFSLYDTSGADEMFPNIDPCTYSLEGRPAVSLPDHGELWSIPWSLRAEDGMLRGSVKGIRLEYSFERDIELRDSTIHMIYRIHNTGRKPLRGLWAFHGLTACDEDTRVLLEGVEKVINVHDSKILGAVETCHSFPISREMSEKPYDLSRICPKTAKKTEKLYAAGRVEKGEAALTLNRGRLLYRLSFPADTVPYLGIWINEGGFKDEYNCALEPSTGFYDSTETAERYGSIREIGPGEALEFYMNIELSEIGG